MTDITELARSLKAAAIDAKELAIIARYSKGRAAAEKFHSLANPANILALVEALEKAQQRIDDLENDEVRQRLANAERQLYMAELAKNNLRASRKAQFRKRKAAEQRIAELESRTITVKLPDIMPPEAAPAHYWGSGESMAYSDGYNKSAADLKTSFAQASSSAGVNVEFE
ncbi:ead/Ea22-like family protein [Klebsiella variicola subsp. variicola]|uniref:ead/Ea22-like family protein n=1 Tax=Klebsiella variicola TaxID=244366 RepID=UPI0027E0EB42|nr:ead/Ea22-like family protein [Klebsiella variicola]MDQ5183837.1 ead/Ea22-like family protein [Klebsiella variicola subsp. variicola]MDQ5271706.1 ead/Ea22-like family protein [Klebsiella variicola subsp. variicola]